MKKSLPQQSEQSGKAHESRFEALSQLMRSEDLRRLLPMLGLSAFLANILALALPLSILQILDRVVANQSTQTLVFLTLGVIVALILEMVLREINEVVASWLGARFEYRTTVACLERLMKVPLSRYQREEPGAYVERILAASKVAEFYSGRALLVLFDLPFVLIYLGVIFMIAGVLVLVPIALLLLFGVMIYYFGNWMRDHVQQRNTLDDRRWGFLAETLTGIHSVKIHMMESLMLRRYERLQEANVKLGEALAQGAALSANYRHLFAQVMIVSVVFACSWLVIDDHMTPGGLAACMLLSVRALQPLRRALSVWMRYQHFVSANKRLMGVLELPFEDDEGKADIPPVAEGLELRNVSLAYPSGGALQSHASRRSAAQGGDDKGFTPIFSGLSLSLKAGDCIGIRGDSGSGKSSLLALMNGTTRPVGGEILADGHSIDEFTSFSVQREISILTQQGAVVAGTILENLTMFNPALNKEALELSAKLGLDKHVAVMRHGYETMLGEGVGQVLPAGVVQLISIVRALLGKPSVVLFDEANISLDMEADRRLREFLSEHKGVVTMVLVTHRPSLMALADRIYTLADGELIEGVVETLDAGSADNNRQIDVRPENAASPEWIIGRQFEIETDLSICLWPMLSALGWEDDARGLIEAMPHLSSRLELSGFCSTMTNLGFNPRRLECKLSSLDARLMPCLHVPHHRPAHVLLKRLPNGNLWAYDSESRSEKEIAASDEPTAIYLFQEQEKLETENKKKWLGRLLLRFKNHILLAFVLTVLSTVLALTVPFFVRSVLDRVIPTEDTIMASYMLVGVAIAISTDIFMRNLKGRVMAYIAGRCEYVLGNSIFRQIVSLPISLIESVSIGKQLVRIKNLESLRDFFLGPVAMLLFELPATMVLIVAIGIINPWVLVVILCSILLFGLLGLVARKNRELSSSMASNYSSARWEFLNESLSHMRSIRAANAVQIWMDRFRELNAKYVIAEFRDFKKQARTDVVAQVLGASTGLLALSLSAYLTIIGQISSGTMMATMLILWRITGPMQNIFVATTSLEQIGTNIRQVENLMKLSGEAETGVSQSLRPDTEGLVEFNRVSFRYNKESDPVLLGVSLTAEPGALLVVAGSDGAGKTTLLMLMDRLHHPQAGTIRLDHVDIRQMTVADLRSKVSYMPQQCRLFFGTVAQNLRMANPAATDEELMWAIGMAGVEQEIAALPEGLNTRISNNRSSQLPYGFRQRLSLARTILKPAPLILLDEPGSGMDALGEAALLRCLQWWKGRATIIMASNRPGHMRLADRVVCLRSGTIIANGKFADVRDNVMKELS